jgi:hypothetical protein
MLPMPENHQISIISEDMRRSSIFFLKIDGTNVDTYWKCDAKVSGMLVYSHDDCPNESNSGVMNISKLSNICEAMHAYV